MKAIETIYKGYRFRSRLEARWAVFFDELGVKWEYEKEGFELGDVGRYLPDFWLPNCRVWCEVKPSLEDITEDEYRKLIRFGTEQEIWIVTAELGLGAPVLRLAPLYATEEDAKRRTVFPPTSIMSGMLLHSQRNGIAFYPFCWHENHDEEKPILTTYEECCQFYEEPIISAFEAARQSRFEFGEKGRRTS